MCVCVWLLVRNADIEDMMQGISLNFSLWQPLNMNHMTQVYLNISIADPKSIPKGIITKVGLKGMQKQSFQILGLWHEPRILVGMVIFAFHFHWKIYKMMMWFLLGFLQNKHVPLTSGAPQCCIWNGRVWDNLPCVKRNCCSIGILNGDIFWGTLVTKATDQKPWQLLVCVD